MAGGGAAPGGDEGGRKANVFGEDSDLSVELNLTALMDILSNLLFFLLASFGATILMAINVSVPVQSPDKSDMADKKDTVTVNVKMAKDGYQISLLGTQPPAELDALRRTVALKANEFDYAGLGQYLSTIKDKYPKSETLILTPEAGLSYEKMIKTMDASRALETPDGPRLRLTKLFPSVVVSTVVK